MSIFLYIIDSFKKNNGRCNGGAGLRKEALITVLLSGLGHACCKGIQITPLGANENKKNGHRGHVSIFCNQQASRNNSIRRSKTISMTKWNTWKWK